MRLPLILAALVALPLAAFFAFVGWHKLVDPLPLLARYHSWTVYLPEWLGRLIGLSELVLAAALAVAVVNTLRGWGVIAAVALVLNQIAAALVHAAHGEIAALPQNAVLVALLGLAALLFHRLQKGALP